MSLLTKLEVAIGEGFIVIVYVALVPGHWAGPEVVACATIVTVMGAEVLFVKFV